MLRNAREKQKIDGRRPPRKKAGQGIGPRRFRGKILDVATCSEKYGWTEKTTRARVQRGLIPFHLWGTRIIFLEEELDNFFQQLPGVSPKEALENNLARKRE